MPGRRIRGLIGVLGGLCLASSPVVAGERNQAFRVFSDGGGREAWVQIVSTGDRMMATPVAIIPGNPVREAGGAAVAPGDSHRPSATAGNRDAEKRKEAYEILERAGEAVTPHGEEDLSLGNLFRIVGDVRYDLKRGKGKSGTEKIDVLLDTLQRAARDTPPGARETGTAENSPAYGPEKRILFSSGCKDYCLGFR